jgi:hypothetical protein
MTCWIASMSDAPTCRRPVLEGGPGTGLTSHCKAAADDADAAAADSIRNRRRSKSALHNVVAAVTHSDQVAASVRPTSAAIALGAMPASAMLTGR